MRTWQQFTSLFHPLVSRVLKIHPPDSLADEPPLVSRHPETSVAKQRCRPRPDLQDDPLCKGCIFSISHRLSSSWWSQHHLKCKEKLLSCTQKHVPCSTNKTRPPTSTEHVPPWSKIQKVSIIHSEPITQTQTFKQQAKHCQLNAVVLKAACSQTKAPRLPAKMKLKKRKIKKLNFQLIHFRRGRLVAAARNIKVGLKHQPLLFFRDEAPSDWSVNDQGESCSPWTGWKRTMWWLQVQDQCSRPARTLPSSCLDRCLAAS